MGTKRRQWPVPLLSATLLTLYGVILFSLSYFLDGHVKVDTFYRAIWTSLWASLVCYHLAWYLHRGHLSERAKLLSVVKMGIFAIVSIGGLASMIACAIVRDWMAAVPCLFWFIGAIGICVVEYRNQFRRRRNTEHEMIESLLGGDPEVSGSLAYTPYGASRKKRAWYRHIAMQILCLVVALVLLFFGFLTVYGLAAFGNDALNIKPFGHIYSVPVGGAEPRYRSADMIDMHIYCEGSRTTKYNFTIILEHGGGTASVSMMPLQTALSNITRVCVYDRPGAAWSQLDRGFIHAGDAQREARELFRLAGEQPPFVIGGHSAGGGSALEFRELYPNDVGGIFMIDSYPLGELEQAWADIDGTNFDNMMKSRLRLGDLMRWFAPLGLLRWALANPNFPENLRAAQIWSQANPATLNAAYWTLRSMVEENDAISVLPESLIQNITAGYLGDLPLLVMAAVKDPSKSISCDALTPRPADQTACEIELKKLAATWRIALAESKISTLNTWAPCETCQHSMAWDRVDWIAEQVVPWLDNI